MGISIVAPQTMKTSSLHLLLAGCCLALFFHHVNSQDVRPITEIHNSGSGLFSSIKGSLLGGNDRAKKRCNSHIDKFNRGGSGRACAILFDEDNCDGEFEVVPEGYTELNNDLEDDAESVLVRPGCVLVGYDDGKSSFGGIFGKDDTVSIPNIDGGPFNRNEPLLKNLDGDDELEEDIEAVECECIRPKKPKTKKGGISGFVDKLIGGGGRSPQGNAADKEECKRAFTSGNSADCIVYDDEDCEVEDWNEPVFLTRGQERAFKFSITSPLRSLSYRDTIESVSVRAGCRLEVYDDSAFGADDKGSDDQYVFRAPANANLHVTLDESSEPVVRDLDDDINSLRCVC